MGCPFSRCGLLPPLTVLRWVWGFGKHIAFLPTFLPFSRCALLPLFTVEPVHPSFPPNTPGVCPGQGRPCHLPGGRLPPGLCRCIPLQRNLVSARQGNDECSRPLSEAGRATQPARMRLERIWEVRFVARRLLQCSWRSSVSPCCYTCRFCRCCMLMRPVFICCCCRMLLPVTCDSDHAHASRIPPLL